MKLSITEAHLTGTATRIPPILRLAVMVAFVMALSSARGDVGADAAWTTYEAEAMKTTGAVLGPKYDPYFVETEASGQKAVKLATGGEYVEFAAASTASALVVRYSLPDAKEGGGTATSLVLSINGKPVRTLPLSSHYSWLYGNYPFSNQPAEGKPRNFYDELRVKDLAIARGDVIRLQKTSTDASPCIVDFADLETVPAPLAAPANALSVLEFGAGGIGKTDDTAALRQCITAAQKQGRVVWVPAGDYRLSGEILVPSGVTIQGAGMWHTTFVGDDTLYSHADRRVRFKLKGRDIHLADFAVLGKLNYRNDSEPNDGVVGADCADSSVARLWIEHTKVGVWIYNGRQLLIEGCRFRNTIADGVNLCVGTSGCVIQNCSARGTGDDCFAFWPAASDQGFVGQGPQPGHNVIRHCTGQLNFLANGAAIYGGMDNRVEDCLFIDLSTGCGILLSTTFPTSDEVLKIDNNFSGTTVVRNCELVRCGGYDHSWTWRAALQLCVDRKSISGILLSHINIRDSISDGLSVVAPGSPKVGVTLSDVRFEQVNIPNWGIGTPNRHALWIREDAVGSLTLVDSNITSIQNDSAAFTILKE